MIIPSSCLGVLRGPRCADRMRPRRPMPVTIISLESARVLGLLVGHPPRCLLAGPVGHPVIEVAARSAHGECRDAGCSRHRSAANGSCASAMSRLIHTTWSPHMIASTGYGWLANDCPSELATCVVGK